MVSGIHQSKKGVVLWLLLFILSNRGLVSYLIYDDASLLDIGIGCGVKSLMHPLAFLLTYLGTASEIASLILSPDLIYST